MAFSYIAGSTTPGFVGLAELTTLAGSSLIRFSDGSFRPGSIPPLNANMPLRVKSSPVPRGGAFVDPPLPDAWAFDLTGTLDTVSADNLQEAIDYMRKRVNAYAGWMTLLLNAKSWTGSPATRFMTVQVNGQVEAIDIEDIQRKKVPRRGVVVPLIAADPRVYSTVQTTTTITTSTNVTNNGWTPAPFTVRFHGPQTDPELNGPGTGNIVAYTGTIASGHYVDITTVDPFTGTMTALLDGTTDAFASTSADSANYVNPGTSAWTATNTSGAGATEMLTRDAYG